MSKKRSPKFVFAAIACCLVLFAVGIGFGYQKRISGYLHLVGAGPPQNKGPLIDRIRVIPPKFGHAPVREATVATCKDALRNLPTGIYDLLEKGGATVNLAPNIEDNWPGSGDGRRPGPIDMTMGEENGRCYGRDVWLYESAKIPGSHELREPRSQDVIRSGLYQLLGHSINDCLGAMTNNAEITKLYNEDLDSMSAGARRAFADESQRTPESNAMGCSEIIGALIAGERLHGSYATMEQFPRTTAYLKKALKMD